MRTQTDDNHEKTEDVENRAKTERIDAYMSIQSTNKPYTDKILGHNVCKKT